MAGSGYRDWVAGDVPTAAQFDTYLQEQTLMNFADASARDTALSVVKAEGMAATLDSVNGASFYSGTDWSTVGPLWGALTSWTPTVTQSGSVTVTVTKATYQRVGRDLTCRFALVVTGSGTGANIITLGGLPVAAATAGFAVGSGLIANTTNWPAILVMPTTTTIQFYTTETHIAAPQLGVASSIAGDFALAAGNTLTGTFNYEAASDA